ncbi:MAG: L-2-hydroxyglutarate oxidase [Halobacteria archaeon]|nr:L-2-hydroxyglutarate oxidase [Halobacteria archaeon]
MVEYDVAVIGGGCVGCSVAKHLAQKSGFDICLLEKEYHLAQHQSGRNSGVLHPGFNYPPGSLKAEFSTEGTRRMKEYCRENDIPLYDCGVLVVATDESEMERLYELEEQASENGVESHVLEGQEELKEHEPHAAGVGALYCPEAASVDSQKYVYTLGKEAENLGVKFYMGHEVKSIHQNDGCYELESDKGSVRSRYVVNAAGLYADRIAHSMGVGDEYRIVPFRGEYYELVPEKAGLVNSMIYPTPDPELPFLGVHYTRRTDGKVIVGPNAVLAFGREAYRNTDFNLRELADTLSYRGFWNLMADTKMIGVAWDELNKSYRKKRFVEAARELVPEVKKDDFARSYAGVRAQLLSRSGELVKDPIFKHGVRSTHVLNAVSPGLTSSLPFGDRLSEEILENFA